uniref:Uncharacterized protein n=1 Tax=Cavia porcellus TaxID=10141 RepID=H0VZI3_CAVPO
MQLLYAFLVLLPLVPGFRADYPGRCSCESPNSVQCYRLTGVPPGIPPTTTRLYISHSKIQHLQLSNLTAVLALEDFILLASGTESVGSDTFKTLSTLKTLELWKNKLRQVPRAPPASLDVLKLNENAIGTLRGSDFKGLKRLRVLELQNNLICSLPARALAPLVSLESLAVDSNNIRVHSWVPDLKHLENLSHLYLSGNCISSIEGVQLLANLTTLEVSQNQLQALPLRLPARLQKLDCSGNLIGRVTVQDFQDFQDVRDLRHLFLDNNNVSLFEAGALQWCVQLSNLALEQNLLGNAIQDMAEQKLRGLKQLQVLNLRNNKISALELRALKGLPWLRGTDVRGGRCAAPAEHKGESWMWSRTIVQQCQPLLRPGAAGPSTHKGEDKEVDEDTAGLAEEEDEDYEVE